MIKVNINKYKIIKFLKRDMQAKIVRRRKALIILKFLKKLYRLKNLRVKWWLLSKKKQIRLKRQWSFFNKMGKRTFFRILNIPRPAYRRKKSKFGKYFLLRQRFRIFYGFLRIRTLQRIIKRSFKKKNSLNYFIYLMESRIDVLLFRLNLFNSVRMARQYITHGNVIVNNKIIRNSNYNIKKNDILTFKEKDILINKRKILKNIRAKMWLSSLIPNYIEYDFDIFVFKLTKLSIFDIPFFTNINTYSFLSFMNFYTKNFF